MRYALHDMYSQQFEDFITQLCHDLLGAGVQAFSDGPDGGRDAVFEGVAQNYPSQDSGLEGRCIIQAKHTSNPIGKYSDTEFSGDGSTSILSKEIPRIRRLHQSKELDHYLLFSNRRCSASANSKTIKMLREKTGVESIHVFGVEDIERRIKRDAYLTDILREYLFDTPLRASPDELAEVILAISNESPSLEAPPFTEQPIQRISFKNKNELNGLSEEYAQNIRTRYLKDFDLVRKFLENPRNDDALKAYGNAVDEFEGKLIAHRTDYENYDKLLNSMISTLIERDGDLKANRRLTRVVFYYMYWACDIGRSPEGE